MLMMKSMAQEVAPYRIRVNSIAPGAIRTPINRSAWETPAALDELNKLILYKRIGESEEVGRCAAWLASDQSDYIIGQTIYIDGGMALVYFVLLLALAPLLAASTTATASSANHHQRRPGPSSPRAACRSPSATRAASGSCPTSSTRPNGSGRSTSR